jgi:hypothetical protein
MNASDLPMYCMLWRLLSRVIIFLQFMAGAFERPCFLWSTTWVIIICYSTLLACCLVIVAMHIWGASTWSILAPVYIFLHMVALVNVSQPSSLNTSWSYRATLFCGCDFLRGVCFALSNFVMITRTILAVYFLAVTCNFDCKEQT